MDIHLLRHYSSNPRTSFMLEQDSYEGWVILAPVDGRFSFSLSRYQGEVGFGDIILVSPGNTLYRNITKPPLTFHFLEFTLSDPPFTQGKLSYRDRNRLRSNYEQLSYARRHEQCSAYVEHLIKDLLYAYQWQKKQEKLQLGLGDPVMHRVYTYLQEHAFEDIRIQDVANWLNLHPSELSRRFRKSYHMTPVAYLTSLRLEKAKTLLVDTNFTLDDIAEQCGYQNGFYLSRMFSKHVKISPSTYRKMYRF